jgi:hypothetical protein
MECSQLTENSDKSLVFVNTVTPRRPGFDPESCHVRFVVDKVTVGQDFSKYVGSSCKFSFNKMFNIHIIRGWYNKPITVRCNKWCQPRATPTK